MNLANPQDYSIYKFEPNNIIMIHKFSKALYQYYQIPLCNIRQSNVLHDNLQQALLITSGVLYKKGFTSLDAEITNRLKIKNKVFYEEDQIVNTFLPVLECLKYLQNKNIIHKSLSPQQIIFNEEGQVMLRDWLVQITEGNKYYQNESFRNRTKNSDLKAIGNMLLEASFLVQFQSLMKQSITLECMLKKLIPRYSKGYILAIYILIKNIQKYYSNLISIFQNDLKLIDGNESLNIIWKKIKADKQKELPLTPTMTTKFIPTSPLLNHSNLKNIEIINKAHFTQKKISKIQDLQNKKGFLEQTKKKNIERVARIIQKNQNGQTNKKPDMALKKMSNYKFNIGQGLEDKSSCNKKISKEEILKFGSPIKRLRTMSKKKNI